MVDMHCHSTASHESKLGVQRAVGLPECATPPQEVYELAKRRGMDFVTITDHDTIAGVLEIADRPDVFISEELTARFRGEPQAVHVLCYGITCEDHEWLQAHSGDVELCAAYMYEQEIVCALAHPYYTVEAPLSARHRRRLAELFGIWEIRNGARARELNRPAATYVATREGIGIGGSDDHAGVDIGRTYSETPHARTPQDFLAHVRRGDVLARGAQGSAAKWAHAAIALAARSFGRDRPDGQRERPDPGRVMTMVSRLLREGDARRGAVGNDLDPDDARCLLRAWLSAVELDHLDERQLIAHMQEESFSHADLYRRACRLHERKLRRAVDVAVGAATGQADVLAAAEGLFEACIAAIPYAPATAFLANEQAKLAAIPNTASARLGRTVDERRRDDGERPRVAILADGIGSTHGVTRTIEEIRQRGVPGFEIDVVGTDPEVDRRLSAVAEIDVPFYPGLRIGVPSLPVAVQTLAGLNGAGYDAIHVCSPGTGGRRRRARRARAGPAAGGQLPHRADRLRGAALGRAAHGRCDGAGRRRLLPRLRRRPLPQPRLRRRAGRDRDATRAGAALGPRRGHLALSPVAARRVAAARRRSTSCTRDASRARRAPSCSPTRSCWRAHATERTSAGACTWCSPAAAPSRSTCASASASTRPSSAGWRATSWRARTRAPTSSCSPAPPTPSVR